MDTRINDIRNGPTFSEKIDRHEWSQLGRQHYVREYVDTLKPVIITGALEHWPARSKWTLDFFQDHYGHLPLELEGRHLSMAQLIAEVRTSTPQAPAPYLRNYPVKNLPGPLQADIAPVPSCTGPNWLDHPLMNVRWSLTFPELYIGGKGATFPFLHYDGLHTHAFLMQIQGVKEYIGFAPDQTPYMYRRSGPEQANVSEINDVENWDANRFALFGKANGVRFTLRPGETLFMPSGWWHTARILSPSITISINGANAANWSDFCKDFCHYHMVGSRLPPWLVNTYLLFVGKWLALLARY
jgi:hypothetical protein